MKKALTLIACLTLLICLCACNAQPEEQGSSEETKTSYTIGICNYVDDASLNQIVNNILAGLKEAGEANDVQIDILYDNANADANVMAQIISNFISKDVDLMVGIATPVALNMQAMTIDDPIPVIFAAVSDPLSCGLVESLEKPGANISGTSDFLNTKNVLQLMIEQDPEIKKVGLLYDASQDASIGPIKQAKEFFPQSNITYVEKTGTNVDEIKLAAASLIAEGVQAVFTPTDNTVMTAELSIYEQFLDAGILHYAGADSFALNGAFLGYGVDYAQLGRQTAEMVYEVLSGKTDISDLPVRTFDNGTATINEDVIEALGMDLDVLKEAFGPLCSDIKTIKTAEEFE
ncbi:MAG: ABC transporter substrate-binding protein [Erysipelotrichaceae bacterium]|nr:ABC transporter substrate-binding protein [Erysipelotrichaceae bacterium]